MSQWWIRIRGRVAGPMSTREIRERLDNEELQGYLECSPDGVSWGRLDQMREFASPEREPRPIPRSAEDSPRNPERRSRSRSREEAEPRPKASGGSYKMTLGILGSVVAVGVIVTVVLLMRGRGRASEGPIALTDRSETEKTRLLESSVCFVVPGHVVTTAKGEDLEGYLLPQSISRDGSIKFAGGTGSGFVISPSGYILTNRHVVRSFSGYRKSAILGEYQAVRGAKVQPQIWVFFGADEKHPAKLEYESPDYDFALLKLETPRAGYFALCDTKPNDIPLLNQLKAVGYPGKDSETIDVTGAVNQTMRMEEGKRNDFLYSTVQRSFPDDQFKLSSRPGDATKRPELKRMRGYEKESYILRHNAAIFGGNSGGPLVCRDGTVIGINTWGLDEPGISFALTLPQLRKEIDAHVPGVVWRTHPE